MRFRKPAETETDREGNANLADSIQEMYERITKQPMPVTPNSPELNPEEQAVKTMANFLKMSYDFYAEELDG